MHKPLAAVCAVAMVVTTGAIRASAVGAPGWLACKSLSGTAKLMPALPATGNARLVTPTISIQNAKLDGCRSPLKTATGSATLKFAKPSNCTLLIKQIAANIPNNAVGTLTVTWNTKRTSTVALRLGFGSVRNQSALAIITGTVTAGLFKGQTETATVLWTLGHDECFGGAPLTSLTFSLFTLAAKKSAAMSQARRQADRHLADVHAAR